MPLKRLSIYRAVILTFYTLPLIPIWYFDYLPLQDLPRHLAGVKVLREFNSSSFLQGIFSVDFFKGFSPIPNISFELFATKLCFFCGVETAGKLFITIYVFLFVLSAYLLCRELKIDIDDALMVALPLVYSSYLYMGFLNFAFGIAVFLLAIWCYVSAKKENNYLFFLGIISIILYASHLFAFASFLFFVFVDLVSSYRTISKRFVMSTALSLSIPILFTINFILLTAGSSTVYSRGWAELIWDKVTMLMFPFLYFPAGFALFFCYIYVLFLILYSSTVTNKVFFAAAVSYLFLYFFLPFGSIEGSLVDVRAIAFGMAILPFSVRIDGNRYRQGIFAIICIFAIINTSVTWSSFSRFDREMREGLVCFEKVEEKSRVLPVGVLKSYPSEGYLIGKPYIHAWGYAFLEKDIMTSEFSALGHHILKYREKPYTPPAGWYSAEDNGTSSPWAKIKENYDYVAIFGRDQVLKERIGQMEEKICDNGVVTLYRANK